VEECLSYVDCIGRAALPYLLNLFILIKSSNRVFTKGLSSMIFLSRVVEDDVKMLIVAINTAFSTDFGAFRKRVYGQHLEEYRSEWADYS
jgi:hypothetical protein